MFYQYVSDAEERVDELLKEGKITEEVAKEVKQMFDNLAEAAYERGMCDGTEYERRYQDE